MTISKFDALHQTRSAINNLLDRYEKLREEGSLGGAALTNALVELHQKHAGELLEQLSALGYSTDGDSPEALEAKGIDEPEPTNLAMLSNAENAILEAYNDALVGGARSDSHEVYDLIESQYRELSLLLNANA